MPPPKPHWFSVREALFPGSLVPLTLIALLWSFTATAEGTLDSWSLARGWARGALAIVAIIAVAIYGRLLARRRRLLQPFIYIRGPFYSVMLHPGSYTGPLDPEAIIGQFFTAFDRWQSVFKWTQIRDFANSALFWVWLKPNLAGACGSAQRIETPGFDIARAHKLVVSYRKSNEPLHQTTLQHELGHVIQGGLTGAWSEQAHHDRAHDHGLR